jgi:hypothetical protein
VPTLQITFALRRRALGGASFSARSALSNQNRRKTTAANAFCAAGALRSAISIQAARSVS